ncbi:T9SS type A sorting domain-containing protein [Hymenobacter sp. AT01-02]|uniref:T9SS type A sorting domain-containing protein n=1 Tax=Hymenobacter sp. AT01-02 TaxID=1571877 RepID=UPI00092F4236|nr:T9SS type A sorting domain-containing protein [Hymenobacter sp. AT01-02]
MAQSSSAQRNAPTTQALSRVATAELRDALGRLVYTTQMAIGTTTTTLPLTNLPAGIYSTQVATTDGHFVQRVVVEH